MEFRRHLRLVALLLLGLHVDGRWGWGWDTALGAVGPVNGRGHEGRSSHAGSRPPLLARAAPPPKLVGWDKKASDIKEEKKSVVKGKEDKKEVQKETGKQHPTLWEVVSGLGSSKKETTQATAVKPQQGKLVKKKVVRRKKFADPIPLPSQPPPSRTSPSSSQGGMSWFLDELQYRVSTVNRYRRRMQWKLDARLESIQRKYARGANDIRKDLESQLSRATALHESYMDKISARQARLAELTRSELRTRQQALNESLEQFKRQYDDTWEKLYTGTKKIRPLTKAELTHQQQKVDEAFTTVMSQYTKMSTELRQLLDRMVKFSGDALPRLSLEEEHVAGILSSFKDRSRSMFSKLTKRDLREEKDRWEEAVMLLKTQQEKILKQFVQQKSDLEGGLTKMRDQLLNFNNMYDDLIACKESKLFIESMNDKILKRVLDCLDETEEQGWEKVVETKGVKVHRKFLPSIDGRMSQYCCVKATGILEASPHAIVKLFEDNSRVGEYNKFYSEGRDLEDINENTKVVWASSPPMFLFKPRDFCTVVHYRKLNDGTVVVVNRGAEHPAAPRTDQYVRGEILMGANIIQPIPGQPNRCNFTMVTQVDPGGFAPPVIVNKLTALGPVSFFREIEAAARKDAPRKGASPIVNRSFSLAGYVR